MLESLELSYNQVAGFYHAPVQAVANGGVLVIDDFGRQQVPARQFLNRWTVPLESRVDFLTLQTGQKFDLPFMVLMVFATNVRPAELVDEAFLRRIHYKVFAASPTVEDFARIFEMYCSAKGGSRSHSAYNIPRGCFGMTAFSRVRWMQMDWSSYSRSRRMNRYFLFRTIFKLLALFVMQKLSVLPDLFGFGYFHSSGRIQTKSGDVRH